MSKIDYGIVKEFVGDILQSNEEIIIHQVNCKGVMGGGIALQIKNKYPEVYEDYHNLCLSNNSNPNKRSSDLLGNIKVCKCNDGRTIINLFAQDGYGRTKCQTDYEALDKCLTKVGEEFIGKTIAIPYKMSCGLAGGDWEIVKGIIADRLVDCEVHIYKLGGVE